MNATDALHTPPPADRQPQSQPLPSRAPLARLRERVHRFWLRLPLGAALLAVVTPLLLLLWAGLWLDMRTREAQLETAYQKRIYNVAQVTAQAFQASFIAADQTLLDLREAWLRDPERFAETVERRRERDPLDIDFNISVVDASGVVRYSSLNAAALGLAVGTPPHFTQPLSTREDRLFVGAPMQTRISQRWLIPLSRRLVGEPDAAPAGVIVFWVSPAFFSRVYERTELYPGSVFTLVNMESGRVLLRSLQPDPPARLPGALPGADPTPRGPLRQVQHNTLQVPENGLQQLRELPPTGTGHWASALDGVERNHAWYLFNDFPLLLVAGEPRAHFLQEAASDRLRYGWSGALLSALIVLTTLAQLMYLRTRLRAAREREQRLELLQKQQNELERSRLCLRQLGQHVVTLRERERQRLAQDLHDDVGQQLSVLRLCASRLQSRLREAAALAPRLQTEAEAAGTIKTQVDDTIASVRRISEDLRPATLNVGLPTAVQSFCDELGASTGLSCRVRNELPPTARPSEPCAIAAYRILQEAATNTLRHAKAHRLTVHLSKQGPNLVMEIHDDGTGIPPLPEAGRGGFGLMGMRERALGLGGRLHVNSAPGAGTTVRVELPLQDQPAAPRTRLPTLPDTLSDAPPGTPPDASDPTPPRHPPENLHK